MSNERKKHAKRGEDIWTEQVQMKKKADEEAEERETFFAVGEKYLR